jgi:hypothetical protein
MQVNGPRRFLGLITGGRLWFVNKHDVRTPCAQHNSIRVGHSCLAVIGTAFVLAFLAAAYLNVRTSVNKTLSKQRVRQYALFFFATSKAVFSNICRSSQRLQLLMYQRSSFTRFETCSIDGVAPLAPLH